MAEGVEGEWQKKLPAVCRGDTAKPPLMPGAQKREDLMVLSNNNITDETVGSLLLRVSFLFLGPSTKSGSLCGWCLRWYPNPSDPKTGNSV